MSELYTFSYLKEVTPGTTPASNLQALPMSGGGTFGVNLQTVESARLRADAQSPGDIVTGFEPFASLPLELEPAAFDALMEGAIRASSTWPTAVNLSGTDISFASADNSINASSTDISTNVVVGQKIFVAGAAAAANNGWHTVVSATSTKIVTDSALTTASAGASITIKGQSIANGTLAPAYSLQLQNNDLTNKYRSIVGAKINAWALNLALGAIANGTFGFAGMAFADTATSSIGSGVTAATERDPMAEVSDFDTFVLDHVRQTIDVLGLSLATATPTRPRKGMGAGGALSGIGLGFLRLTGQLSVYQGDSEWALLNDYSAGTKFRLGFSLATAGGYRYFIDLPKVLLTSEAGQIPQRNADGQFQFNFTAGPGALYTGDTGTKTIQISRVAV